MLKKKKKRLSIWTLIATTISGHLSEELFSRTKTVVEYVFIPLKKRGALILVYLSSETFARVSVGL